MAARGKKRFLFVVTHESIGLGEDGPDHQPIEQLASLRCTPNLDTWRPCDAVESAVAWKYAIERNDGPSALIFSRQNLQHQNRDADQIGDITRGGYVLKDCIGEPELILRSEEHTSELQSLMRISYAVFCLKKKTKTREKQ